MLVLRCNGDLSPTWTCPWVFSCLFMWINYFQQHHISIFSMREWLGILLSNWWLLQTLLRFEDLGGCKKILPRECSLQCWRSCFSLRCWNQWFSEDPDTRFLCVDWWFPEWKLLHLDVEWWNSLAIWRLVWWSTQQWRRHADTCGDELWLLWSVEWWIQEWWKFLCVPL